MTFQKHDCPDQQDLELFLRDLKHDFRSHLWIVSYCLDQLRKNHADRLDEEILSFIDGSVEAVAEMRRLLDRLSRFDASRSTVP